jgi:hypothetical protein
MRNLLKLSLITSLLTVNLLAWSESETEQRVNTIGTNSFNNTSKVESIEKSVNTSITDTFEPITKTYYGEYQTSYEPSTDSEIATITKKGLSEEIYGSYNYTHDLNSGTITKTQVEKGLLERVSELESNSSGSVDLTAVNNNINQNTTLATDANTKADNAISQNTTQDNQISNIDNRVTINANKDISQDVVINQNVVSINDNRNAIQTTNLRVDTFDSRITSNTNLSQSNRDRLNSKDIKDAEQDSRLDYLEKNNQKNLEESLMNERAYTKRMIDKGISMSIAMNTDIDLTRNDKAFGIGIGAYNGHYSLAGGLGWRYKNASIKVKVGVDSSRNVGASGSISWGF